MIVVKDTPAALGFAGAYARGVAYQTMVGDIQVRLVGGDPGFRLLGDRRAATSQPVKARGARVADFQQSSSMRPSILGGVAAGAIGMRERTQAPEGTVGFGIRLIRILLSAGAAAAAAPVAATSGTGGGAAPGAAAAPEQSTVKRAAETPPERPQLHAQARRSNRLVMIFSPHVSLSSIVRGCFFGGDAAVLLPDAFALRRGISFRAARAHPALFRLMARSLLFRGLNWQGHSAVFPALCSCSRCFAPLYHRMNSRLQVFLMAAST